MFGSEGCSVNSALFFIICFLLGVLAWNVVSLIFALILVKTQGRKWIKNGINKFLKRVLSDRYDENVAELWSATRRINLQNILELSLRAETGGVIERPLGTPKHFKHFDGLMFIPAQMHTLPLEPQTPVDMKITLGVKAERPLKIDVPLLIGGMGYGVALSEEARVALAKGAKRLGTALNSGEGPFLPEEQNAAGAYIWQIGHGAWSLDSNAIAKSQMVEIHVGQGARIGGEILSPDKIKGRARQLMGISPVESAVIHASLPGIKSPNDWRPYVADLRKQLGGKPIGVKLMGSPQLEKELAIAMEAGFDVISIDGSQGGTSGSAPILQDDFGWPTLHSLIQTRDFLLREGVKDKISLVIGGGFFSPGECLKAIALGADAVSLGTVPLYALVHAQIEKVMPWEPLTQLVYYNADFKKKLNIDQAAQNVYNVINAMVKEMEEALRALGKASLQELSVNDLAALDEWTATITGVKKY